MNRRMAVPVSALEIGMWCPIGGLPKHLRMLNSRPLAHKLSESAFWWTMLILQDFLLYDNFLTLPLELQA